MTATVPLPRRRRHTLHFLSYARAQAPVHLDTEVDMTAVAAHRTAARSAGRRYSWTTYLLHCAGRVLADHPEANAVLTGRVLPRITRGESVDAKIALDRRLDGHRVVLSAVLPDVQHAGLDALQAQVDGLREGDPHTMPEFAGTRLLHRLPLPLGAAAFRAALRSPAGRRRRMGTFALSSLGHTAVDGFHSAGGTTVTLNTGRVSERVVVRGGAPAIAPVMRLDLTFDHRVIDGAEAAEVLTGIRDALEGFADAPPEATAAPADGVRGRA
ncbi:2-oxo acid dehydrogenase subunit E2 [Streptomyces sp. NPDC059740]|uniref:2-oxo acid dehydrogenase subunit E2 n=1 Tax=Streptomyces sp. NPDC059740 TaxID=3346926 RepID=UPI0036569236